MDTVFRITQMIRDPGNDFVTTAHWTAIKSHFDVTELEDSLGYTASTYGTVEFIKQPDQKLINYSDLTEAIVLEWVSDFLGVEGLAAIEELLSKKIEDQKNPPEVIGVSWSSFSKVAESSNIVKEGN
jgi:hypothetical protein